MGAGRKHSLASVFVFTILSASVAFSAVALAQATFKYEIIANATDDNGLLNTRIDVDGSQLDGTCVFAGAPKWANCTKVANFTVGTHPCSATTTDTIGQTNSTACSFTVPGWLLSIDPTRGVAIQGNTKTTNATLTNVEGVNNVTFSATNVPVGTIVTFSPTFCTPSCYSNASIATSVSTPIGSHLITILATGQPIGGGSAQSGKIYNLTVLANSCNNNLVCENPETQQTCPTDCKTTADIIPSTVRPSQIATVVVEFWDFRYLKDDKLRIRLKINPEGITWNPTTGCWFGGQKIGNETSSSTLGWPVGTISQNGHFKISTTCVVPSNVIAGAHTLVATPTIF